MANAALNLSGLGSWDSSGVGDHFNNIASGPFSQSSRFSFRPEFLASTVMELSEEVRSGLKLLAAAPPSSVGVFFDQIALRVMDQCAIDDIEGAFSSLSVSPGSKGLVTASVSTAVVEGARQSVGEAEFCAVLEACGLKKDSSQEAARVFFLRCALFSCGQVARYLECRTCRGVLITQLPAKSLEKVRLHSSPDLCLYLHPSKPRFVCQSNLMFRIGPILFTSF